MYFILDVELASQNSSNFVNYGLFSRYMNYRYSFKYDTEVDVASDDEMWPPLSALKHE